ncbi:MAG: YkgJ family cysteine cluster protein [Candidatus Latescibacteria bacterium]|nr:YkgJ family cysteine cluster protein [Candidatus Latescibacterota bacterium]
MSAGEAAATGTAVSEAGSAQGLGEQAHARLEALYDRVPRVSCRCDRPGWCCELTAEEDAAQFATMYPLYTVEYLNVLGYVRDRLPAARQEELLGYTEERPKRCPFLTREGACSIHPARPLVCRTYGVLSRAQVDRAGAEAKGKVPERWVREFLHNERQVVCLRTDVLDPEKIAAHAEAMVTFAYERELIQMGMDVDFPGVERRQALESLTGMPRITRWSWGGFNALAQSVGDWFQEHFEAYWTKATLGE